MTTMTTRPIGRDQLIDEANRLQHERAKLDVIGPMLARLRCDLRYHQMMTHLLALTEARDDDAWVPTNGRCLMHQVLEANQENCRKGLFREVRPKHGVQTMLFEIVAARLYGMRGEGKAMQLSMQCSDHIFAAHCVYGAGQYRHLFHDNQPGSLKPEERGPFGSTFNADAFRIAGEEEVSEGLNIRPLQIWMVDGPIRVCFILLDGIFHIVFPDDFVRKTRAFLFHHLITPAVGMRVPNVMAWGMLSYGRRSVA